MFRIYAGVGPLADHEPRSNDDHEDQRDRGHQRRSNGQNDENPASGEQDENDSEGDDNNAFHAFVDPPRRMPTTTQITSELAINGPPRAKKITNSPNISETGKK